MSYDAITEVSIGASNGLKLSEDVVIKTIEILKDGYAIIKKFAEDTSKIIKSSSSFGFGSSDKGKALEEEF